MLGRWLLLLSLSAHLTTVHAADSAKVAVLYDQQFLLHNTGAHHPERPERLSDTVDYLKVDKALNKQLIWPSFKPATTKQLSLVHTPAYLNLVAEEVGDLAPDETANLSTGDTVISSHTLSVAKLAAGAAIKAADLVMQEKVSSAFVLSRPPGHHATRDKGMGFCVYNNVAIAAEHLRKTHGLKRVLIVDFDVHHGNGTQDIFYDDDGVFYFSVHQSPLYPRTGDSDETGVGKGEGFTINVPLKKQSGDAEIFRAINTQLVPAMQQFKPEFILISAGFDSHAGDLLGGLNYSDAGYKQIAQSLATIANQHAKGRMVYVLEGGYVAENIARSVAGILKVLQNNTH